MENSVCGEISTNAHNNIPQTMKKGMKTVKNDAVKETFSTKKKCYGMVKQNKFGTPTKTHFHQQKHEISAGCQGKILVK